MNREDIKKVKIKYEVLCHIFIEASSLFSITHIFEILISAFRPHPREIMRMSHDKIRILYLSNVLAFIKYIVYKGFLVR